MHHSLNSDLSGGSSYPCMPWTTVGCLLKWEYSCRGLGDSLLLIKFWEDTHIVGNLRILLVENQTRVVVLIFFYRPSLDRKLCLNVRCLRKITEARSLLYFDMRALVTSKNEWPPAQRYFDGGRNQSHPQIDQVRHGTFLLIDNFRHVDKVKSIKHALKLNHILTLSTV